MMHGLYVLQDKQTYAIYTPMGIQIALIFMGNDGQVIYDAEALKTITRVLSKRWGLLETKNKNN